MFPIIGPRTLEQLSDNMMSADITLSASQIQQFEEASSIVLGFSHDTIAANAATLSGDVPADPGRGNPNRVIRFRRFR